MRNLIFLVLLMIFACKEENNKSSNGNTKQDSTYTRTIPDDTIEISDIEERTDSVDTQNINLDSFVKISLCTEEKSVAVFDAYKGLFSAKEIVLDTTLRSLYYSSEKKAIAEFFQSEDITCILPAKGGAYRFFDMYYSDLRAENMYRKIIDCTEQMQDTGELHGFFKRGLVFVLDEGANKITMITFNPFPDNKRPAEVSSYFLKNKSKFDKAVRIIGYSPMQILVE